MNSVKVIWESLDGDRSTDSRFRALMYGKVFHTRTCVKGIIP